MRQLQASSLTAGEFNIAAFACGDVEIDSWIQGPARRSHELGRISTYVLHESGSLEVLAFTSVSMGQVKLELDGKEAVPMGCLHMAFLGRSRRHEGQGLGRHLVLWAIHESRRYAKEIACRGVALNCRRHRLPFYEGLRFRKHGKTTDERGDLYKLFFDNRLSDEK